MITENVLSEFENVKEPEKPISWFSIAFILAISVFEFVFGYLYYRMWKDYGNPQRIIDSIIYFSAASFMLSTSLNQLMIRYLYVRKSDLKKKSYE